MRSRTIAIGDVHGCSAALDALLEAIRPHPADDVVTLGDYINRGPDSRGVIEGLIELENQCRLVPLLGNHDQTVLDVRSRKYPINWLRRR
jgi:serine/threonine protein phosphatase 1